MASGKSKYLERSLLDHVAGSVLWTPPASVFVALSLAIFDDARTGADLAEPAGGAYTRVTVTNSLTQWPAATTSLGVSKKSNAVIIQFPTPTVAWGTVLSAYVCMAGTAGEILFGGDLAVAKAVAIGDNLAFAAGTISWEEK